MSDFTANITITANVQVDGDGSAQFVTLTIKGALLDDSTLDAITRQVSSDCNLCDTEDIEVLATRPITNNIQALVKKHGGFKFTADELETTYKAEVAFKSEVDDI